MFQRWKPLLIFGLLALAGSTGYQYAAVQRRKKATQVAVRKDRHLGVVDSINQIGATARAGYKARKTMVITLLAAHSLGQAARKAYTQPMRQIEEIGAARVAAMARRTATLSGMTKERLSQVAARKGYFAVLGELIGLHQKREAAGAAAKLALQAVVLRHKQEASARINHSAMCAEFRAREQSKAEARTVARDALEKITNNHAKEIKRKTVFDKAMMGIQANKALQNNAAQALVKIVSLHIKEVATRVSQADLVTEMKAVGLQKELSRVASRASLEKIVGERKEVADTRCKFAPSLENIEANGFAKTEGIEAINQTLLTRRLSCVDIWQANKGRQARLNLEAINRRTHEDNMNLIFVFPEARAAQRSVRHY